MNSSAVESLASQTKPPYFSLYYFLFLLTFHCTNIFSSLLFTVPIYFPPYFSLYQFLFLLTFTVPISFPPYFHCTNFFSSLLSLYRFCFLLTFTVPILFPPYFHSTNFASSILITVQMKFLSNLLSTCLSSSAITPLSTAHFCPLLLLLHSKLFLSTHIKSLSLPSNSLSM